MITSLEDMPQGTIGFRASGELTAGDYRDVLVPAIEAAVDAGDVRALFVVGPDHEGFELDAVKEDLKGLLPLALEHRGAWKRLAAVTDVAWIAKAVEGFKWIVPGEVRLFSFEDLEEAKDWLADRP